MTWTDALQRVRTDMTRADTELLWLRVNPCPKRNAERTCAVMHKSCDPQCPVYTMWRRFWMLGSDVAFRLHEDRTRSSEELEAMMEEYEAKKKEILIF